MKLSKKLTLISTVDMPREKWLEIRSKTIGGSDAAAVVGLNAFVSPYALWAEKTGKTVGFGGNLATEVGTYMEDFIACKFATETGKKVRRCNNIIYNPLYPWAHVNIDRDIVGEDAGLECKYTDSINLKKYKGGEYPTNFYAQCVHCMAVTGAKRWYLAVLIGNKDFRYFTIERDEEEIAALMEAEGQFYDHVKSNTPPPADGSNSTTNTLAELYPESNGETVDIFAYDSILQQYTAVTKQIKELENLKEEAANKLKAFLGEASRGESNFFKVTWDSTSRETFDLKRFAADFPQIDLKDYFKKISYRTFKVSEKISEN